jgi:hypothetical protein
MEGRRMYHEWNDEPVRLEGKNAIGKTIKIFWKGELCELKDGNSGSP